LLIKIKDKNIALQNTANKTTKQENTSHQNTPRTHHRISQYKGVALLYVLCSMKLLEISCYTKRYYFDVLDTTHQRCTMCVSANDILSLAF
jgi:hypothetical protein